VDFREKSGSLDAVSKAEELLSQFTRCLPFCPQNIKLPQPLRRWGEL
jgi:hypothetical protein